MRFQKLRLPRDPHCPSCGESPSIQPLTESSSACASTAAGSPLHTTLLHPDALPWISLADAQQDPSLRWIDIRTSAEFIAGHIPGAAHIPLDQIEQVIASLKPDSQRLLLYCQRGARTVQAYFLLKDKLGHRLFLLEGGYETWLHEQYRVARNAPTSR